MGQIIAEERKGEGQGQCWLPANRGQITESFGNPDERYPNGISREILAVLCSSLRQQHQQGHIEAQESEFAFNTEIVKLPQSGRKLKP